MRVVLTGSDGFLGRHTRVRLRALTEHELVPVARADWDRLPDLLEGADVVLHVAGVNRGSDADVRDGNLELAEELARAIHKVGVSPRIVYANSIQVGNGSPYSDGKGGAGELLERAAAESGGSFVDVRLPNLFGEDGRANYNSFVASFVAAVIEGRTPQIVDRDIALLHVQGAAQALIDAMTGPARRYDPAGTPTSVRTVFDTLARFHEAYATGDIPGLVSDFDVDLFNTLRAALFPKHYPIALTPHADDRGRLVETVRSAGGPGQTFLSTTRPGITRGEHFHLRKVERFVVVSGSARISLRRVFGSEVVSYDVTGAAPVVVDMPTMWIHNITNTGSDELITMFWTNSLFDPANPDTYWEKVNL